MMGNLSKSYVGAQLSGPLLNQDLRNGAGYCTGEDKEKRSPRLCSRINSGFKNCGRRQSVESGRRSASPSLEHERWFVQPPVTA